MKLIAAIVALVAVILIVGALGHFLLLGAVGVGGFLVGSAYGRGHAALTARKRKALP